MRRTRTSAEQMIQNPKQWTNSQQRNNKKNRNVLSTNLDETSRQKDRQVEQADGKTDRQKHMADRHAYIHTYTQPAETLAETFSRYSTVLIFGMKK